MGSGTNSSTHPRARSAACNSRALSAAAAGRARALMAPASTADCVCVCVCARAQKGRGRSEAGKRASKHPSCVRGGYVPDRGDATRSSARTHAIQLPIFYLQSHSMLQRCHTHADTCRDLGTPAKPFAPAQAYCPVAAPRTRQTRPAAAQACDPGPPRAASWPCGVQQQQWCGQQRAAERISRPLQMTVNAAVAALQCMRETEKERVREHNLE